DIASMPLTAIAAVKYRFMGVSWGELLLSAGARSPARSRKEALTLCGNADGPIKVPRNLRRRTFRRRSVVETRAVAGPPVGVLGTDGAVGIPAARARRAVRVAVVRVVVGLLLGVVAHIAGAAHGRPARFQPAIASARTGPMRIARLRQRPRTVLERIGSGGHECAVREQAQQQG